MRFCLLIIALVSLPFSSFCKYSYNYVGYIKTAGEKYAFEVAFDVNKDNLIVGQSITAKGTSNETKCRIKGKFNPRNQSFYFYETVVLNSKAKFDNLNFCLLSAHVYRKDKKDEIQYTGKFTGKVRGTKKTCASGNMYMATKKEIETPAKKEVPKSTPPPVDTLVSHVAAKKMIEYDWKSTTVELRIWDDIQPDGDRVTIYQNGKIILKDYELQSAKKTMKLSLLAGSNYIKVVALNEGKAAPNTSQIELMAADEQKRVIAHIRTGEMIYIKLSK